jgi:predicted nucleic acid-binding protein
LNLYAESSAVLAWLLGEPSGNAVRDALRRAEIVAASDLTLVECDRVLIRAVATGEIDEGAAADRRALLNTAVGHWQLWHVGSEIIERARRPFPKEPIRTLDAIHLASALVVRSVIQGIEFLSLDERIRRAAKRLGFALQPERVETV